MSRTDVHRPWRVQVTDPYNRHRLMRYGNEQELLPLYKACRCDHYGERAMRRYGFKQARVIWRSIRQELVKLQDHEDVDVGPIKGSAWG